MSKLMKTSSLTALLSRAAGEYVAKDSIYEIPGSLFRGIFALEAESPGLDVMSGRASLPVGPAAGPHSQIAPNILAAYLSGARVFELKTVQENDRLDIDKPCIDALDEGHNVEWSTELTLEEARREYLNAWIVTNLAARIFSHKPGDFFFNMSVGYTLAGIKSAKVDAFIEGMRRPEATPYWSEALAELSAFIETPVFRDAFGDAALEKARTLATHFPVRPVHSVTLSTMHGCPPDEIERIGRYLIEEKGFDCYVKLNPTLVGYDMARDILDRLGWDDIILRRESFEHDLQLAQAIALIESLQAAAGARGRRFGIKLSNTLANANDGSFLPGAERYMSGRALFPITARLAAILSEKLPDFPSRFSYCGGVSALNAADLVRAGVGPLTIATDILKPGGYLRLTQIAREASLALSGSPEKPDADALRALADAALERPEYRKEWKSGRASIDGALPVFDCFAAPCVQACPVGQKVPAYVKAAGCGSHSEALATILSDNPLPHITGVLCDHVCQEHCSRVDYEGSVRIRDVKLACARSASLPVDSGAAAGIATGIDAGTFAGEVAVTAAGKGRTAVIGAGPAGLACAHHLALAGHAVTVFDMAASPGGVPANVIPRFRIGREEIAADIERIRSLGVEFVSGREVKDPAALKREGYDSVFVGSGAHIARTMDLKGSGVPAMHAHDFLAAFGSGDSGAFAGVRNVLVAGGGNTACDAVRAATRIPGVESVRLAYRRTKHEMPADREELDNAIAEASALIASALIASRSANAGKNGTGAPVLFELALPESVSPGTVTLRKMTLGDKDASGRRAPEKSDETFDIPCDLLVTAVGESPDRTFLESLGIECGRDGRPVCDPATLETRVPGLYVGGDARRGPASIIAAEADGRKAAYAILAKAGRAVPVSDYAPPEPDFARLALRGEALPSLSTSDPGFAGREAERCLACDSACLRCVEVCPNRANLFVATGARARFAQALQIVHIDRLCNECGNCGRFCPWEGEPFRAKPTLFDTPDELAASDNPGFAFSGDTAMPTLTLRTIRAAASSRLDYAAWNGASSPEGTRDMVALARIVWREHRYLTEANA
ncbi:MAG: putative selenate reductase subunit YgfK [Rectinemataceae bacterium]